ncbi:hypothetical protein [Streptomyces sp. NPDC088254]|uniref:hypothetical protein n=1 Tax=Streptomyces sp. NPDC088254 TaxID=3365847 RepID=UPI0038246405
MISVSTSSAVEEAEEGGRREGGMCEAGELRELLRRAGLEVVGEGRASRARPAAAAWRPVIAGYTDPTLAVPADRADPVAEVNRQWHRLAVEHDVINPDGEFLISVTDQGRDPEPYVRCSVSVRPDLLLETCGAGTASRPHG